MKGFFKGAYADAKRTLTSRTDQAMETDEKANGTAEPKPKTRKVKKQVRKGDLPLSSGTASLDQASKNAAAEKENSMFMEDKLVADTEDKKNELESYIYELRGKIDDQYSEFASDEEKAKLKEKLEQSEVTLVPLCPCPRSLADSFFQDWLYEEGEDATRGVYVAKMDEIRFVAGPIVGRYQDKIEAERQAILKAEEEKAAKKRAELEAKKKAEEEAKKAKEEKEGKKNAPPETAAANGTEKPDAEMKDAEEVQPDGVDEPMEDAKK